jgi:hypothetical protein
MDDLFKCEECHQETKRRDIIFQFSSDLTKPIYNCKFCDFNLQVRYADENDRPFINGKPVPICITKKYISTLSTKDKIRLSEKMGIEITHPKEVPERFKGCERAWKLVSNPGFTAFDVESSKTQKECLDILKYKFDELNEFIDQPCVFPDDVKVKRVHKYYHKTFLDTTINMMTIGAHKKHQNTGKTIGYHETGKVVCRKCSYRK